MIERVKIKNWQSLRDVDLVLGRFTVVVGPSSSGKTAFMRALRVVASNVRGGGDITRGATSAAITVHTGEHTVTLERSESSGLYRVVNQAGEEESFTKLAGSVPEAITRILRIQPVPTGGTSLNFAGQFDRPFLLVDSGASVARVLGELTNVEVIFSAVREANKRRSGLSATLKTRQEDLKDLQVRARQFLALPAKLAACDRAEQALETAAQISDRVGRLHTATEALVVAQGVLERFTALPQVPTDTAVTDAQRRLASFRSLIQQWSTANNAIAASRADIDQWDETETGLHTQLHDLLTAAGTCPTCGQATR